MEGLSADDLERRERPDHNPLKKILTFILYFFGEKKDFYVRLFVCGTHYIVKNVR